MFKFIAVCALFAAVAAVHHEPEYHQAVHHHEPVHHHVDSKDAHAEVKSYHSDVSHDGFKYDYETSNNIRAAAHGDEHGNVQGEFEWVDPKGEHVLVKYVADEHGYQPASELLPTPPPVPEAILKSLEYIRAHPPKDEDHHHTVQHTVQHSVQHNLPHDHHDYRRF